MKSVQPHGPYNLFGWSFAGNLAFEIARQLVEIDNEIVDNLFMLNPWFYYIDTETLNIFEGYIEIRKKYKPTNISPKFRKINIVLFKAGDKSLNEHVLSEYNNLDIFMNKELITRIQLKSDHVNWIKNNDDLNKVCNFIDKSMISNSNSL